MSIKVQDPLFLLSAQTGMSAGEIKAKAAEGNPDVNKAQVPMKIGEPIPVIFCRRRNNNGGVLVQPKMTEASFSNSTAVDPVSTDGGTVYGYQLVERVDVKYLLVLSEGDLPQIQVRDLFYGNSRKGTFNQTYDGRAGTWNPGNTIDDYIDYVATPNAQGQYIFNLGTLSVGQTLKINQTLLQKYQPPGAQTFQYPTTSYKKHEFPTFTGTSGSYSGLTTLSFEYQESDIEDQYITKSISVFVRSGLQVTRLVDSTLGESDNFVDLVKYLFQANNRLADDLIDSTALTVAANFVDANGFLFNGELKDSQNFLDWLQATSTNFLLKVTNSGGKFGLKPRLPYNTDYTIKTTQISVEFTFTEEHILPGGFELEYISLEDREPVCFVVQWRQQPEADFGLVRTVQVRYENEAANGPFIDLDMSNYCTNEDHAVKAGTYRLAQRKFVTHHLRLTVREQNYNVALTVGDLVRVRLRRETSEGQVEYHDKIYEINRIEKTFAASITYDLTHFPIDALGRSIVAREVDAATGAGNTINVGRSTFDGDENSSTDTTTIGTSSGGGGTAPSTGDTSVEIATPTDALVDDNGDPVLDPDGNQLTVEDASFPGGLDATISDDLTEDPIDIAILDDTSALTHDGSLTFPSAGDNAQVSRDALLCDDGRVCFYRVDKDTGVRTLKECVNKPISGPFSSSITTDDIDHYILAIGQCPDPSSPDGYGVEINFGQIGLVSPDFDLYRYVRWTGTISRTTNYDPTREFTNSVTTNFLDKNGSQWNGELKAPRIHGLCMYSLGGVYSFQGGCNNYVCGPCEEDAPWRSGVWAITRPFSTLGGTPRLGGLRTAAICSSSPPAPSTSIAQFLAGGDQTARETYTISGTWQFSNDQSTIDAEWTGSRTDVERDVVPEGADPADPTYSCG